MKRKNLWQALLSAVLMIGLLLPTANLAKGDDVPFVPPTLVRTETSAMTRYANELNKYATDCQTLRESSRLLGEKLKKCLIILKDLRTRFDGFLQSQLSFVSRIENARKWTKELDDDFEKNAAKRGANSQILSDVSQAGGFRSFFQSTAKDIKGSKSDFDFEIKDLEELVKTSDSSESSNFQIISTKLNVRYGIIRKIIKAIKTMVDAACSAVCCNSSRNVCGF